MDFLMNGLNGLGDPASLGLDAARVLAINELANWFKERLAEWTWDDKFSRLYVLIPFLCALLLTLLMSGFTLDGKLFKDTLMYGLWASFTFRAYKVGIKGE